MGEKPRHNIIRQETSEDLIKLAFCQPSTAGHATYP